MSQAHRTRKAAAPSAPRSDGRLWRWCRLLTVALVLLAGALSSPAPAWVGLPWPGSLLDVASFLAAAVLVVDLWRRGVCWPPWVVLALAMVTVAFGAVSLTWSAAPLNTLMSVVNSLQALALLWSVVALLRGESPTTVAGIIGVWVVAIIVPCALLWARVPGFLPPADLPEDSGDYISYFARLSHPYIGRSNNVAVLLVVFVLPLAVWGVRRRDRWAQVAAAAAFVATVMTVSRGTLIALAVAAVALVVVARPVARSLTRWAVGAASAAVVAVVLMVLFNPATRMHLSQRASTANVTARADLAVDALGAIREHPWLGQAPAVSPSVHNVLLQQLVDLGVVGGLVLVALLVGVVAWWFRRPAVEPRWLAVACGLGVAAQLGSFLVEAGYEAGFLRNLVWLSWGLLLALYASERASGAVQEQDRRWRRA